MSLSGIKKSPLSSVPFLKKRLRRITALGLHNLTVNEFNFTVHFTLHRNEKTVAFYTSECVENQRSPEWSYLQFPACVQCLQDFVLRVWITSSSHSRLFLEYDIYLDSSLIPDEQKAQVNKDNDTLWLEIFGYRFTDDGNPRLNDEDGSSVDKRKRLSPTKSYNRLSIIRMNNVIQAIRSEHQTAAVYLQRLQAFLNSNEDYSSKIKERESHRLRNESLRKYLHFQKHLYQQRLANYQQKRKLIEEKKNQSNQNLSQLLAQKEEINAYQNYFHQSKSILRNLTQIIVYRQREIINEIYHYIYPIQSDPSNEYSITNIKLPQAENKIYQSASSRDRDYEIAAAIAFCSHFLLIISQFIQFPLRYPIDYHGISSIRIHDYSSETSEYPLYPTSNLSAFRYGFFLLNRNIGQLMYHCRIGDRNTDFRNTLENLKGIVEEYILNPNNNHQNALYPSLQTIKPEENAISKHRYSTVSSLFLSSLSSTSSLMENDDNDPNEDVEFFAQLNAIKPRLTMQISHQIEH